MPILNINTNIARSKIPEDFLNSTAALVAEVLHKPLSYVVVHINPDQLMSWGGTSDPCASASLCSIGNLGKKENIEISKKLFPHFKKSLDLSPDRVYIEYIDLKRENVGYAGTTFADL